jgi:hypothetical protein
MYVGDAGAKVYLPLRLIEGWPPYIYDMVGVVTEISRPVGRIGDYYVQFYRG